MTRREVGVLVWEERDHQEEKWGPLADHPHEVGGWLTLIRVYLAKAEQAYAGNRDDAAALAEVRKLTALGFACLEQHMPGE